MAQLTINIPASKVSWLLDGIALRFGYQADLANPDYDPNEFIDNAVYDTTIPEDPETNPQSVPNPDYNNVETLPNPESKAQFAKRFTIEFLKREATQGYISEDWRTRKADEAGVDLT